MTSDRLLLIQLAQAGIVSKRGLKKAVAIDKAEERKRVDLASRLADRRRKVAK